MLLNCGVGEDLGLRVPWTAKRSNQSILKNMSWIFTGRTDAKAEAPVFWPPDSKNWLIGKDPDAGKDWRREEKGMTEDEMVGWHHQLDGHEFEQAPGVGDGQGSLACCSTWGLKESGTTKRLNWTELRNLYSIPTVAAPAYIPTNRVGESDAFLNFLLLLVSGYCSLSSNPAFLTSPSEAWLS